MKSGYTPRSVEGESTDAAEEYAALGSGQATANLARAVDEISGAIGTSAVSWFGPGSELGNMAQSDGGYDAKLAVVSPASTTDVQSLIRIASRCDCRLVLEGASGSISGPSPRQPSRAEIRVDLRRMNRIIAVDDARAYAIVEPGVTYFDLYEYLRAGSHDLAMLVPDEAGVSVLDHVLYRSSQRRWRRGDVSEACGLEVVLPSGEVVRTGDVHSHYVDQVGS